MITLYSGTPGSGKSLHMAKDIYYNLLVKRRPVIANFSIDMDYLTKNGRKRSAKFTYVDNRDMTVDFLYRYARENHVLGKEGQTFLFIDECQLLFNSREFARRDRAEWVSFFTQHRKLGYHIILCTQFDKLIDKQIRCLLEYEVKHRKLNNFGPFIFLPVSTFVAVTYWYSQKERIDRQIFTYKKKYAEIYDSFMVFDGAIKGVSDTQTLLAFEAEAADQTLQDESATCNFEDDQNKNIDEDGRTQRGEVPGGTRCGWSFLNIFREKKSLKV